MATIVIKLGSSIVADEAGELRLDVLEGVCGQVKACHEGGDEVVLVTSGAIARGMRTMDLGARPAAMDELQAASAVGQGKLYGVYDELLTARGLRTAQVLLTFFDMSSRMHYLNARRTLRQLLAWHVVPVINENDTTATDEITFGDNDFLAAQVSLLIGADLLVLLTDMDGLHTADPRSQPDAELVTDVRDFDELDGYDIGSVGSRLGSGGMTSKVVAAEMATAAGIPAVIADGNVTDAVSRAAAGEPVGTRFHPQQGKVSSFKLWLRYAKPSRGRIEVDSGAERALREQGTSLLPVGVVGVEGDFGAGDAVDVASAGSNGAAIGKGIASYSADELRSVMGRKTEAVRELLPRAADEAVHRDYFVLD